MFWYRDPFTELERLRRNIDDYYGRYGSGYTTSFPLVNIYDKEEEIRLKAELPGTTKDDIDVTYTNGVLTLSGNRKGDKEKEKYTPVREERSEGEFEKSFKIPYAVSADKISASFSDGVLTITLPKAEEAKPKKISVNVD